MQKTEKECWDHAKELLGNFSVAYQSNWKFDFLRDPKDLFFLLSKCKFAMRMACRDRTVLELGCEMGAGASILGEQAKSYTGVDSNPSSITLAKKNLFHEKYLFVCDDYLTKKFGKFETIVSFDTMNQLNKERIDSFLDVILEQLTSEGILILGCKVSNHLEMIQKRLKLAFHQIIQFGMNGEIIHTNIKESPYRIYLCCHQK